MLNPLWSLIWFTEVRSLESNASYFKLVLSYYHTESSQNLPILNWMPCYLDCLKLEWDEAKWTKTFEFIGELICEENLYTKIVGSSVVYSMGTWIEYSTCCCIIGLGFFVLKNFWSLSYNWTEEPVDIIKVLPADLSTLITQTFFFVLQGENSQESNATIFYHTWPEWKQRWGKGTNKGNSHEKNTKS
jgi:hypothetical protein